MIAQAVPVYSVNRMLSDEIRMGLAGLICHNCVSRFDGNIICAFKTHLFSFYYRIEAIKR